MVIAVLDHDPIRLVEVDELRDLAEAPLLLGLASTARAFESPVNEHLGTIEKRKAESFSDGVNGENALHGVWTGSDPDPEVMALSHWSFRSVSGSGDALLSFRIRI